MPSGDVDRKQMLMDVLENNSLRCDLVLIAGR